MVSEYLLGDVVYVNLPSFKGLAQIGGVDNRRDGIYYYLTAGTQKIFAHSSEIEAGIPIASSKMTGSYRLIGRLANG